MGKESISYTASKTRRAAFLALVCKMSQAGCAASVWVLLRCQGEEMSGGGGARELLRQAASAVYAVSGAASFQQ